MINRRRFLAIGTAAGASLLLRRFRRLPHAAAATPLDARRLKKFVDELPRPKRLREGALEIAAVEFEQQLHAELPPTRLWGYAGTYPGPTIEVTRGVPIRVTWRNQLMQASLLASLPVDRTLHWANPLGQPHSHERYEGPVPLVTHLHGGETEPESDGHPEAWFTPEFARKGPGWKKETYDYHNGHPAATLWYHDHALGITRLTVYAGLAGFYLVRDPDAEGALNLPAGDYEREILIQDRSFDASGHLLYPQAGQNPSIHPFWVPEFFGNTIVVNGKVWPYMNVEPRKYRLRLLNGSNARFYRLRFSDNRPFTQIGTDGGFLSVPVRVKSLLLAPAERADVIVDFSGLRPGATLQFSNNARAPFPGGDAPDPRTVGQVMQFRVVPLTAPDTSTIPHKLVEVPALPSPALTRTLSLIEEKGKNGPLAVLLDRKKWSDQVSETPQLGSTEVWEIVNLTEDTHPIHLHLVNFQILNRQTFRAEEFTRAPASRRQLSSYLRGPARAPEPNERGWKDTVRANPKEVTRLLVRFAPIGGGTFPFDATAAPGYPWHCHILEHEDNEMMRPYVVTA
jgi:FtsP/CotA-like multicopper oxidase with cupredoxin domain